jgi:queuine tRNA-ribosyltransferase
MLGPILLSWHNIAFYQQLMRDLREAVIERRVREFVAVRLARWEGSV